MACFRTILAMGLASITASATAAALPPALAQAAAAYDRAQVDGNRAELERLLAEDYRLVNGTGEVETKAQFVAESVAPGFKLDRFAVTAPVETVWRDGAVLAGEVRLTGIGDGRRFAAHIRFADVWARRDGRWRVVFTEVTRLPAGTGIAP